MVNDTYWQRFIIIIDSNGIYQPVVPVDSVYSENGISLL